MKSAYDLNHVKSVKAWGLLFDGEMAGRIVSNFSDNPNGSVCTSTVGFWGGPLKDKDLSTGTAGGCGYDKFSASVESALSKIGVKTDFTGRGAYSVRAMLEGFGYKVIEVI